MPHGAKRLYLVAYDISDARRLNRVKRHLDGVGLPLQYSVYLAPLSKRALLRLLDDLGELIDPAGDDVRIYPVPATPGPWRLGVQAYPEGIMLLSGKHCWTPA